MMMTKLCRTITNKNLLINIIKSLNNVCLLRGSESYI